MTNHVESKVNSSKQEVVESPEQKRSPADSDEDSVLCSDDDYDEDRDVYFLKNKNKKFYPLNCKQVYVLQNVYLLVCGNYIELLHLGQWL